MILASAIRAPWASEVTPEIVAVEVCAWSEGDPIPISKTNQSVVEDQNGNFLFFMLSTQKRDCVRDKIAPVQSGVNESRN